MMKLSGNWQVGALACHGMCMSNKLEKVLRPEPYHGESFTMSIGCWPLHLSYRLLCRMFVSNHNFKTKRGHTSATNVQGGYVLHLTDQVDSQTQKCQFKHSCYQCGKPHSVFQYSRGEQPLGSFENTQSKHAGQFPSQR